MTKFPLISPSRSFLHGGRAFAALLVLLAVALAFSLPADAAKTPDGLWIMQQGQNRTQYGDIVSSCQTTVQPGGVTAAGYCSYYRYYIEIPYVAPPDYINFAFDIFDADVNAGGANEATAGRDRNLGGTGTTIYTLYDPSGTVVATASCAATCTGALNGVTVDGVWARFATVTNPASGHWELRVNSSNASFNTDYVNAYGLHAYDTNGGKELNMYSSAYAEMGINQNNAPRTYSVYPYVTYGPQYYSHDFDLDDTAANDGGYLRFISRTGATDYTIGGPPIGNAPLLSGNDVWNNFGMNIYTTDYWSGDYGIWREDITLLDYGPGTGNYGVYFNSASATPPTGPATTPDCQINGMTSPHRMYFPTESGVAPLKPFMTHDLTYKSGPNPPAVGGTTVLTVTLRFTNPTPYQVTFSQTASPQKVLTANVPGGTALYGGNATVSQGSIVSQPAVGGSGNIVWDPGVVASGTTVTLSYDVNATPTAVGQKVFVTGGSDLSGGGNSATGTTAVFLDETMDAAHACGTVTFGPLAALAVTQGAVAVKPLFSLTKSAPSVVSWVSPGPSTITYTISYTNIGGVSSTNTVITDVLVAGLTFVSASGGGTYNGGTRTVTWNVGTVNAGASGTLTLVVTANRGTYTNSAALTSTEITVPDNSNTTSTTVGGLRVSKSTTTPSRTYPTNTTATYTITVVNEQATAANDIVITDALPAGFSYNGTTSTFTGCQGGSGCGGGRLCPTAGATNPVWQCTTTLAAGATMTITFNVTIPATAAPGTYSNPVRVTSSDKPGIPFDETTTTAEDVTLNVSNDLAVSIAITSISSPCNAGTCSITYQVTARNVGANASTSSSVTMAWPGQLGVPTWSATNGGTYNTGTGLWTVGGLAAGASATLTLTATVSSYAATITTSAALTASNPGDTDASNNNASISFVPTATSIAGFKAVVEMGKVVLAWKTMWERDTMGFYLYRLNEATKSYDRLNKKLLPGLMTSSRGGSYRVIDTGATAGRTYTYVIEEVEGKGKKRRYGPYVVTPIATTATKSTAGVQRYTDASGVEVVSISGGAHALAADEDQLAGYASEPNAGVVRAAAAESGRRLQAQTFDKDSRIKIAISAEGMYLLTAKKISELMGTTLKDATAAIKGRTLSLSYGDSAVAYRPLADSSGIVFYGQKTTDNYTEDTVYWLKTGSGLVMEESPASGGYAVTVGNFTSSAHFEKNAFDFPAAFGDADADYWFWEYVAAGNPGYDTRTFSVNVPAVSTAAATARLTARLYGASDSQTGADHHAIVSINGTQVAEASWRGIQEKVITANIDQKLLREGSNDLVISGILDATVPYSIFFVNSFDLQYQRFYRANANQLSFRTGADKKVTVEGFTSSDISLYDLTNPLKPKVVTGAAVSAKSGAYQLTFVPKSGDVPYFAVASGGVVAADRTSIVGGSKLKTAQSGADYLVITDDQVLDEAQRLADYRQKTGLKTMVVTVGQIMDEFNNGRYSPSAIREFIRYAYRSWSRRPGYVVLAGSGTYDYKNILGFGGNLVPVLMVGTPDGLFPSDTRYADMTGDNLPDIAIGRLPGYDKASMKTLVDKIIAYESAASGTWSGRAIMAADQPDAAGDFPTDRDMLAGLIPSSYNVQTLTVGEASLDQQKTQLLAWLNAGAVFMGYVGHGGVDRLSQDGLLTTDDVNSLVNASALPVMAGMTCVVGQFGIPGYESLSELLLQRQGGGAAAVWSPTGTSLNEEAVLLARGLLTRIFSKSSPIGMIATEVAKEYAAAGGLRYMIDIYNLLGDPALKLRRP